MSTIDKSTTELEESTTELEVSERLVGKDLLNKIKFLSTTPKKETVIQCGYTKVSKTDGSLRADTAGFYEAVLCAKGVKVAPPVTAVDRAKASVEVTVHKNGQILIGASHTKRLGLSEGDVLSMQFGNKSIKLVQV